MGDRPVIYTVPPGIAHTAKIDRAGYDTMYRRSLEENDQFWGEQADRRLSWEKSWDTVRKGSFERPDEPIEWFSGGRLNVSANCLDRHLAAQGDRAAILWEPDAPEEAGRRLTYRELHAEVCRFAAALRTLGVKSGEVVTLYLPMIPEAVIAMLACARIGAVHSAVFGGFSPESLKSRIEDGKSRFVITADEGFRAGKTIPLKANVDRAVEGNSVDTVIVVKRSGGPIAWMPGRDRWWHELDPSAGEIDAAYQSFDAEHPLFLLYTSGSTGRPKGIEHRSAGYLLYAAMSFSYVFDYRPGEVYWCTADIGWITGHSYLVYGPLACGATVLMFEGVPTWPDPSRCWQVIDKYQVAMFYTAPTAIRLLMREGDDWVKNTRRTSLRILGSVDEPINPEAWRWYYDVVGEGRARIVDTYWQTETGGHVITPLAGAHDLKPGSAMQPFFGIEPALLSDKGLPIEGPGEGALCIARPWPGLARTIHGDHARFAETYLLPYPGYYFSGDAARRDADGDYWIAGRMDDVINVSGHRIGTAEVESALVLHPAVTEAAVVGIPHEIKGQDIYAFVTCKPEIEESDALAAELRQWVKQQLGAHYAPGTLQFTLDLPKTRSGKIMRRILRKIAEGAVQGPEDYGVLGDISTLLDPGVVDRLVDNQSRNLP